MGHRVGMVLLAIGICWASFALGSSGLKAAEAGATLEQRVARLEQALPAATTPAVNAGDNAWMLVSSALVLMMTAPGLILFYGGLVRSKNVLGTMMHSLILMALVSALWMVFGYSMAFAEGNAFMGNPFRYFLLHGVGGEPNPDYAGTVPQQTFMLFQMMFAIITPALISGAVAERIKFSAYVLFVVLWVTFVYFSLCHMVWGKGGCFNWALGGRVPVLDFAGGTVVHARFAYDDSLDVFGVHAVGSITGMLMLGFLADAQVNTAIASTFKVNGVVVSLAGCVGQFANQLKAVLFTIVFAAVASLIILKIVNKLVGLRVDVEDETAGLDLTQHGERAYTD
jgi:ammonia channel protein AmtB